MKHLYFDMVAPSRGRRQLRWALAVLGAACLLAALAQWRLVSAPLLLAQRQQVQEQRARMGSDLPVERMKPAEMTLAWQRAQAVSQQLNLPWSRFFLSLGQTSAKSRVALLSVEPDAQKGQLIVLAEARDFAAMLQFVAALQTSDGFSGVTLQSHTINRALPEKPVRFRLSAKWSTTE
jgi:Tfp pilus assembly protein PilN